MTNEQKQLALSLLGIGSTLRGDEMEIHCDLTNLPTETQLKKALTDYEAEKKQRENARQAALQKLTEIGLTLDDLNALGLSV